MNNERQLEVIVGKRRAIRKLKVIRFEYRY